MRILNWNTEFVSPRARKGKFQRIRAKIAGFNADVICLTEAFPETMPEHGHTVTSEPSGAGNAENRGARKVLLWSRFGWSRIDTLGSPDLPEGRFISAETKDGSGIEWTFVGMCIPWRGYRNTAGRGQARMKAWAGASRYLDTLREEVLPRLAPCERTILVGDFNLQIPAYNYPYEGSEVNQKRKATFDGWLIPTAGISRRFIDHIAMSSELRVNTLRYVSRFDSDGRQLSDHDGVCIDLALV